MDDKHKELKKQVQRCYDNIKYYNEWLDEIREECEHPETKKVNYSPRPGQIFPDTQVCSVCGEVIKWPYEVDNKPEVEFHPEKEWMDKRTEENWSEEDWLGGL